jgi:hypothetical protein
LIGFGALSGDDATASLILFSFQPLSRPLHNSLQQPSLIIMEDNKHHGSAFRKYLPDITTPRFTTMRKQTAREYAEQFKEGGPPPWLYGIWRHWRELYKEPYLGLTNNGIPKQKASINGRSHEEGRESILNG